MKPACLTELVGLRQLCQDCARQPEYYLDDIPGLSRELLAELANLETVETGAQLAETLVARAADNVMARAYDLFLSGNIELRSRLHSARYGYYRKSTSDFEPPAPLSRGLIIRLNGGSRLSRFFVKNAYFTGNTAISGGTLTLKDGFSKINTYTFDAQPGITATIPINATLDGPEASLLIDHTGISPLKLCVKENCSSCFTSCTTCSGAPRLIHGEYASVYGWDGDNRSNYSYGLGLEVEVRCDLEPLVCEMAQAPYSYIARAMWRAAGAELYDEWLNGSRFRSLTLTGTQRELAQLRHEELTRQFEAQMRAAAASAIEMLKSYDPKCVACIGPRSAKMRF